MYTVYTVYMDGITWLEKPSAPSEYAVAEVIKKLYHARKSKEVEEIIKLYTLNAEIKTHNLVYLDVEKYKSYLLHNIEKLRFTRFDNVFIRILDKDRASVTSIVTYRYTHKTWGPALYIFDLVNERGEWKISKTEWLL